MNAQAVNFHVPTFGPTLSDVQSFRPERWLESKEQADHMERAMLQFGYGKRVCIGKHVSCPFRV